MSRTLLLVVSLVLLTGCTRILAPILGPGFKAFLSAVIVDIGQDKVKIEAAWTVSEKTIRDKAKEGCMAQSTQKDQKKVPTKEISRVCGGIGCLTTVHLFACKTEAEIDTLRSMDVRLDPGDT